MDNQDQNLRNNQEIHNRRLLAGLFLVFIGGMLFLRQFFFFDLLPHWIFSWPMLLIVIGIYSGVKHQFRNNTWLVLIIIGGFFLVDRISFGFGMHRFLVPVILGTIGLALILRPRHRYNGNWDKQP